ncbi:LPXTG-motif cell wall-anchored protein [Jeotgalicoccus halotolerans]|uniref:LPXTG-motif cell wall-anchored protein n=1 Tax=Jeotgalicoccus halotolerans TaxID=157227 RepID=A0A3E0B360_9STAP|nr:LPXTG-motif cell wall-anchored protein [Jeotgalicoccus halotolerans]
MHDITDESAIVYTVEEVAVEGFDSEITGNAKDGYTVTNTEQITPTPLEPATTSVPVEKVWELQDKEAETVTIHLLADGERVDTVDLSAENDWKHTFTDLPTVHDITDESAIVYTVEEVAVEGFDSEITGNAKDGYTVTNTEQIDLNGSGKGTPSKEKDKPSTGQPGEVIPSKGNNEPSKGYSEDEASSENDHKDSLPDTGIANNTPVYLIITLMAIGMIFLLISYITRRNSSK